MATGDMKDSTLQIHAELRYATPLSKTATSAGIDLTQLAHSLNTLTEDDHVASAKADQIALWDDNHEHDEF